MALIKYKNLFKTSNLPLFGPITKLGPKLWGKEVRSRQEFCNGFIVLFCKEVCIQGMFSVAVRSRVLVIELFLKLLPLFINQIDKELFDIRKDKREHNKINLGRR